MKYIEQSLCLLKPDALRRALTGEILQRIERIGLKIVAIKMLKATPEQAKQHYLYEDIASRHSEAVWNQLIDFICSDPIIALVVEGPHAIEVLRKVCGTTEPRVSPPGSIRGDFCCQAYDIADAHNQSVRNVIHASADQTDAEREIAVWFSKDEIASYRRDDQGEHYYAGA